MESRRDSQSSGGCLIPQAGLTMNYGYDPKSKCLFSWDKDFKYEGKVDAAPAGAFIVEENFRQWTEMAGCQFLSGSSRDCLSFHSNGKDSAVVRGNLIRAECNLSMCYDWDKITSEPIAFTGLVCVSGYVANDPVALAKLCKIYPCNSFYVCPIVEELAAFGVLIVNIPAKKRPRRVPFCVPNEKTEEGDSLEYDPKLDGDGYGRMADAVRKGFPAVNEMMDCPGISPFYGRVLAQKTGLPPNYIIRNDAMKLFFPTEPLSITHYAATSVPVEVTNTPAFRQASGCQEEKVHIVVATDYIPNLSSFMNFYKIMSGKSFIGTAFVKQLISSKKTPVFRYSRAYDIGVCDAERVL